MVKAPAPGWLAGCEGRPATILRRAWNSAALKIGLAATTVALALWIMWGPELRHAVLYPQFGDVADWAGATGTLAAVIVALYQTHRLRVERLEDLRRQAEQERTQVYAWIAYRDGAWWVYLNNLTHATIGVWALTITDATTSRTVVIDVTMLLPILPGFTQHPAVVGSGDLLRPVCRLEFADSTGKCWAREASGALHAITEIRVGDLVLGASAAGNGDRGEP
jgi:hypothetical protein